MFKPFYLIFMLSITLVLFKIKLLYLKIILYLKKGLIFIQLEVIYLQGCWNPAAGAAVSNCTTTNCKVSCKKAKFVNISLH